MSIEENKSSNVVSIKLGECKICSDALATVPVVILTKDTKRVCKHFFHKACVEYFEEEDVYKCPVCWLEFNGKSLLPNILQNPEEWYKFVDFDQCGTLSYEHIMEVLQASLHIDHTRLAAELPTRFQKWDTNGDGSLSYEEMMDEYGLVSYAREFLPKPLDYSKIPDIRREKRKWFNFWDEDKNGRLSQEEVIRALLKTFRRESSPSSIIFRDVVKALWSDFDPNDSKDVDVEEFCMKDGLYETVLAGMQYPANSQHVE